MGPLENDNLRRRAARQDVLVAPCAFDGPINGEKFRGWVPELRKGDIVILDNLSNHKVEGVRTAIENADACLLYLPPYSPDLNPIEQWFAKLKALLRKAAARTFDALIQAIASALETFSPDERANYLANSGIDPNSENALLLAAGMKHPFGEPKDCRQDPAAARELADFAPLNFSIGRAVDDAIVVTCHAKGEVAA